MSCPHTSCSFWSHIATECCSAPCLSEMWRVRCRELETHKDKRIRELEAELIKSRKREIADVQLPDGSVAKFCTPETRKRIAELEAENERLRGIVEKVAAAFEPPMDSQLAGDERAAVHLCREAAKEKKKP